MVVELKGTIKLIEQTQQVTDNFSKRDFVVTIDETSKYPQDIVIQAVNDRCGVLNNYSAGQAVIVRANLNGREAKGRYFNTLSLYTIELNNNSVNASNDDDLPY